MVEDYDLCVFVQTDICLGIFFDERQDMSDRNKYVCLVKFH